MKIVCLSLLLATQLACASVSEQLVDKKFLRFDQNAIQGMLQYASSVLQPFSKKYHYLITDDSSLKVDGFVRKNSIDEIDEAEISNAMFLVFFHTDDDYCHNLKK